MKVLLLHLTLWSASFHFAQAHLGHGNDCANPDPSEDDRAKARAAEIKTFGKPGEEMTRGELSDIVQSLVERGKNGNKPTLRRNLQLEAAYTLKDVPIVHHVLTKQGISGSNAAPPSATAAQLDFLTTKTNELFNIYDKLSKTSIQWASFVHEVIYHDDFPLTKDCNNLSLEDYNNIIKDSPEWEFKLHNIICESTNWSGVASFPNSYSVDSVLHNMVRCEYRAVSCHDDSGNFLCDLTDGQEVSHTRWWRTRSTVLGHELGHLFG